MVNSLAKEGLVNTAEAHRAEKVARVYYLSLEYLPGRLLENNLLALGLYREFEKALVGLGLSLKDLVEQEDDMALGNGGLGRLAACFLDSLSTLNYPSIGYGMHYEFGLFCQSFRAGRQEEKPEMWLRFGNPWPLARFERTVRVPLYGHLEKNGRWRPQKYLLGVPWDVPIIGWGATTVNCLRLWRARATRQLDLNNFQKGDYIDAVRDKILGESISKVLYPNDATENGRELRLAQQYFFAACSVQDIFRRYKEEHSGFENFPLKARLQLNDTHPALAIVELLRIFLHEEHLPFETAWPLCQQSFAYTNHTLLPEALEKWDVALLEKVVPCHLALMRLVDQKVLKKTLPSNTYKELSLFTPTSPEKARMAHLAIVGSSTVNGVAALHTKLLKTQLFKTFHRQFPHRFQNKTNGITPRRFLKLCNAPLAALIDETLGEGWVTDLPRLSALRDHASDPAFQESFMNIKKWHKKKLAKLIQKTCGISLPHQALFDLHIKRLHEYKRQHLNLLQIIRRYHAILDKPEKNWLPKAFIFAGKAAPNYVLAKDIIHAIHQVGDFINKDKRIGDLIKVVFLPNYRLSLAEKMIPAAELSQQISLAGKEASGTGNMKLALNGALTLGTLDGANVEILEAVGKDNFFLFGLTAPQVHALQKKGYQPTHYIKQCPSLQRAIEAMAQGAFTPQDKKALKNLTDYLTHKDPFMACADFKSYTTACDQTDTLYKNPQKWAEKAILQTANMGRFSSDNTIHAYAQHIWKIKPQPPSPHRPYLNPTAPPPPADPTLTPTPTDPPLPLPPQTYLLP